MNQNDIQWEISLKEKARSFFAGKLEHYKESGDRSDFGRVIDSIVDMSLRTHTLAVQKRVEKLIDENDDGMWAGRETAEKILTLINDSKKESI